MDITAFLTARLDEVERSLPSAFPSPWRAVIDRSRLDRPLGKVEGHGVLIAADGAIIAENVRGNASAHIARHDPARVLAEVKAKRAIVRLHDPARNTGHTCANYVPGRPWDSGSFFGGTLSCPVLRYLAAVYADHPDFNPAWRVA